MVCNKEIKRLPRGGPVPANLKTVKLSCTTQKAQVILVIPGKFAGLSEANERVEIFLKILVHLLEVLFEFQAAEITILAFKIFALYLGFFGQISDTRYVL